MVSPRTLCLYDAYSYRFQGAFLDTVVNPDSVDDRKGAVSLLTLSSMDIQLDACLVLCRVDTSVASSSLLLRCEGHVQLCRWYVIQYYSSRTSYDLLLYTRPLTLSLAFSLLQHCSAPSTLSVKLMVEATTFRPHSWDALVSHMRGVSRQSGAQQPLLCQTQV